VTRRHMFMEKLPVRAFGRVVFGALLASLSFSSGANAQENRDLLLVEGARAAQQDITDPIKSLGTLTPRETVNITATVSDKVKTIHADDGAAVAQGDLLVSLESAEERAAVKAAKALVDERRLAYSRAQDLASRKSGPLALAEERKAALEQAEAQLETARARLADREIHAPFAGRLGFKQVSPGALIRPADIIFSLWATDILYLDFTVADRHMAALTPGLVVRGYSNAYPDRVFTGTVALINPAVDSLSRAVKVRAVIDNGDEALKPGMALEVQLDKAPRRALLIPEQAIVPSDQGQRVFTITPEGDGVGTIGQAIVTLGARQSGTVEIIDGLVAGALVVTRGTLRVRDGQKVRYNLVGEAQGAMQ